MPVAGLLKRAETLQSPVYVSGAHEKTHRRKASQMHCEYTVAWALTQGVSLHLWVQVHPRVLCLAPKVVHEDVSSAVARLGGSLSVINAGVCERGF